MSRVQQLVIRRFAQIEDASIALRDLTFLVGPQATGKSLALQLLTLAYDGPRIARSLDDLGYSWSDGKEFAYHYFGEGMENAWSTETDIRLGAWKIGLPRRKAPLGRSEGSVFYIPAHRTLTIAEGLPREFRRYSPDTPYVVKQFSEQLRLMMQRGLGRGGAALFPQDRHLTGAVRDKIDGAVFHGAELRVQVSGLQRRLMLSVGSSGNLPYMAWTAGQREFIPLLLGLYYLLPLGRQPKRDPVELVIVEEPEMGLHPDGVMAVLLPILALLGRGYRVVVSTHSPLVIDLAWALGALRGTPRGSRLLCEAFDLPNPRHDVINMMERALACSTSVVYFDYQADGRVRSKDISELDPSSDDEGVRYWGGLTRWSSRFAEVVGTAANGRKGG
ncbi:MAG: ATP-binding protein [Deltaproteobacteria bacterium]|nr:ATP-binding protein [Deltaproteobacteria bacterium]